MNKKITIVFLAVIIAALGVVIGLIIYKNNNSQTVGEVETYGASADGVTEKWQEGVITYNGKEYKFNTKLKTYLFMGIDKMGIVEKGVDYHDGGQSDAMFLLVVNEEKQKISIVAIPRNSMVMVDEYYENGEFYQQREMQICLAHAYGDAGRLSCNRAQEAVSRMFYQLPINGYFSINMGAVPIVNSTVDGVTLTAIEDVVTGNTNIKTGDTVTLTDQQAYDYVHYRKMEFGGANLRLDRETQYMNAYIDKLLDMVNTKGKSFLVTKYQEMEPYVVTNLDFVDFINRVSGFDYNSEDLDTVPGHLEEGQFDEYYIDKDAFYQMILDIWYLELSAGDS